MGGFKEYQKYDATGLAELVKNGSVSATELLEAAISRAEQVNARINAIVHPMYDIARKTAKGDIPGGPFKGVPFLLKDLLDAYEGVPMSNGCKAYRKDVSKRDSELVRRYKQAGLVVMGKTNTPEFGLMGFTEPELFGPCRNPWDTNRTPGGSSGGSAAAVAAGIVPMASGGDGGGSIRIPSSCCGLFGIKPSRGRNPLGPDYGELWQGAVVEHVLCRSVRDSAAALDAIQGADPGAPYSSPAPGSFLVELGKKPGKLRIAIDTESPIGKGVDAECVAAVEKTAKLLEDMGHTVERARPKVDGKALAISYFTMVCGETAADVKEIEEKFGKRAARDEVELGTRTLALLGRAIPAADFVAAIRLWNKFSRAVGEFFLSYDVYVTPTMSRPPVRIGELAFKPAEKLISQVCNTLEAGKFLMSVGLVEKIAIENLAAMPFTQLGNLTGMPAMSVPLHWSADGLPIGVQFAAPLGEEARLFRLAARLEEAAPWFDKRPAI